VVVGPVHTCDAETNRRRDDPARAESFVHHLVQHFFDRKLTRRLEVGASGARAGNHAPLFVCEETDGFGAAGVETKNMSHVWCAMMLMGSGSCQTGAAVRVDTSAGGLLHSCVL
jgi:hypothetical protein